MLNEELLIFLKPREKPSNDLVNALMKKLDFNIDAKYLEYITSFNGGEGDLNGSHVILYEINDLILLNPYYEDEFCDKIFVIGSNGGDAAFAIRKQNSAFIIVPFLDMNDESTKVLGQSFEEFLNYLYTNENVF